MHRAVKNFSHSIFTSPAEIEWGDTLPSSSSSHIVNECLFCSLFNTTLFALLCFLLEDLMFKMSHPLSLVAKCCLVSLRVEGSDVPYWEDTCIRQASFQAEVIILLAVSSMLINQKYILNRMSLNSNTNEMRLYIDRLMKMWLEAHSRNLTLYFYLGTMLNDHSLRIQRDLTEHNSHE